MRIAFKNGPATPDENVRVIERRIDWLNQRIKAARKHNRNPHFDLTERDALQWALDTVTEWIDIPKGNDDVEDSKI